MSDKTTTPPAEAPKPQGQGAVIRKLESATETAHERLIKKHLPAWVISGAVNIGLVAILLLLGARTPNAKATDKVIATSVEREDEPPQQNLTNEDPGLQSNLEAAIPDLERVEKQTVDALVTQDNIGQPNAPDNDTTALALPGISSDPLTPGAAGDLGNVMSGAGNFGERFATFPGRSGATKSQLLKAGGGNERSEQAVARALAWLARQQRADGSWVYDVKGDTKNEIIAATGMAILPFLAAGETHKSAKKYQKTVRAGLEYLVKCCPTGGPNAGKFTGAGNMYAQGIGALALCEAYGMTKDKGFLLQPAQAAINFIQRAQASNGSWGYQSGNAGDTSIVGWQVQALQAARLSRGDLVVDDRVIKKAIAFLNLAGAGSRKSSYGYNDNTNAAPGTSLTAVGLLCRYYIDGWGPDNGGMAEGVQGLMKRSPNLTGQVKTLPDMYFYYYATQVVHFFEGEEWRTWNEGAKQPDNTRKGGMRDLLIDLQNTKAGANEGSWEPEGGFIGRQCGRLGTTAMCVLTLEVYYRHLPLYKRANAGDPKLVEGAK